MLFNAELIDRYERLYERSLNGTPVTQATIETMQEFWKELDGLKQIHPSKYETKDDKYWAFWISVPKGEPEAFDEEVDTEDDYKDYLDYWN